MSITILPAKEPSEIHAIEQLAQCIWREHYTPIIGAEQVEYMLKNFQSVTAMHQQISEGYQYFSVFEGEQLVGYYAFQLRLPMLFLSKFYLTKSTRGCGYARLILEHISQQGRQNGATGIQLTVNRDNTNSIAVYRHLGFKIKQGAMFDIGSGFVMDDWIMEITLSNTY